MFHHKDLVTYIGQPFRFVKQGMIGEVLRDFTTHKEIGNIEGVVVMFEDAGLEFCYFEDLELVFSI